MSKLFHYCLVFFAIGGLYSGYLNGDWALVFSYVCILAVVTSSGSFFDSSYTLPDNQIKLALTICVIASPVLLVAGLLGLIFANYSGMVMAGVWSAVSYSKGTQYFARLQASNPDVKLMEVIF